MEIGAQFYTVREQCQNLEDFALTLKKVADIGYRNVQISGTCPYPAQWLKEQLDRNGLKCVLTHIPVPRLTGELDQVIAVGNIAHRFKILTAVRIVGLRYRPLTAGNGGRGRGSPRLPSIEVIRAVSSPQTNAPAPRRSWMSKLKPVPKMSSPSRPYS